MQEILTRILEFVRDAWRFRWHALLISWLLAIGGWLFVCNMPNQYEVNARIHIDTRSAIQPLLHGLAVTPDFGDQVDLLVSTVLSHPNLEKIARKTGMSINATTPKAEQKQLNALADDIHIKNAGRRINLFSISYASTDADRARAVVQQVINIMTSMALGDSGQASENATQFLSHQVDRYKSRVDSLEKQIATYKKNHADLLPSNGGYIGELQSLQSSITQLNDQLSMAKDRRESVRGQMNGSGGGFIPPDQTNDVRAIDNQLAQKRNQLQQMLERYTPKYPDVISLKHDIARLKSNRQQAIADARANPQRASAGASGAANGQLSELNIQINSLEAAIKRKDQKLSNLKANSGSMTSAQAHLSELTRNYDAAQQHYQKLLDRLYTARLSSEVNRNGDQLKFRVIDPPETPRTPTGPKRVELMTVALLASLAGGAAFAFFLSQIRPVFINRRALTEATGLPVLGSVSLASTTQQAVRRQTALALFVMGLGTLMLGYLAAIVLAPVGAKVVPSLLAGQWL